MNNPNYTPAPPGQTLRPRMPLWGKVALGCGSGCGLLLILFVILAVFAARSGGKSIKGADLVARQFLTTVSSSKSEDAYNLCSSEFIHTVGKSSFVSLEHQWREMTGTTGAPKLVGQYWYSGTGGTQITLAYDLPGSKQKVRVKMVMISHGGPFRVLSCYYSPIGN